MNQLNLGESETVLLAKELNADIVITDENRAYKIAQNFGLNVVRTLSILLKSKQQGIISDIKPVLDEMIFKEGMTLFVLYREDSSQQFVPTDALKLAAELLYSK